MKLLIPFAFLLSSCASTTFYNECGQKTATFQGNMVGMTYVQTKDGVYWRSSAVDHSSATTAYGESSAGRMNAAAAAIAGGITLLK